MTDHQIAETSKKPLLHKAWLLIVAVGLVFAGGWAYAEIVQTSHVSNGSTPAPTATSHVMRINPAELFDVSSMDLERTVKFNGDISPIRTATLSAQVSGIATRVNIEEGEAVHEGDVLLEIDATDLELKLSQALSSQKSTEAQLQSARQTLERTQTLSERGLAPDSGLDTAKAAVDQLEATVSSLEAQVDQVRANLVRTRIRAPFDGVVASRSAEPGQLINAGTALFSIVDLSRVTVEAMVPISDAPTLTTGMTARFHIEGSPDHQFEATVDRINPVAETGTRSVMVFLTVDNEDHVLRGGMFATGKIAIEQVADVVAIPESAVTTTSEGAHVLLVADGRLIEREIETARAWQTLGMIEIADGLTAGERILAKPLTGLEPGQSVLVEE